MQRNESRLFPLTKWRLGDNTVLRLIHCLNPIVSFDLFMDNYFTSFCLLTHLEVNNIGARGVLKNNSLYKYTITGDKQLQLNRANLKRAAHV